MQRSTLAAVAIAAAPLLFLASPALAQGGTGGTPTAKSPPGAGGVFPSTPGDTVQNSLGDGNTHRPPPHGTYDPWEPAYGYPRPAAVPDTIVHQHHHHSQNSSSPPPPSR
jgi:hypothetical protein